MPARVDAEERHQRLVMRKAELIAAAGIGALTHQGVAGCLGASPTVVTHYFGRKRELVLQTYQTVASRSRARAERGDREDEPARGLPARSGAPRRRNPRRVEGLARLPGNVGRRPGTDEDLGARSGSAVERIARLIAADI